MAPRQYTCNSNTLGYVILLLVVGFHSAEYEYEYAYGYD